MKNALLYRLSLILTILLTLVVFFTMLAWLGQMVNGVGRLPALALVPWKTLGLVGLTAINCSVRVRFIKGSKTLETAG